MKSRLPVMIFVLLFGAGPARSAANPNDATSYDGHWSADIPGEGRCPRAHWEFDVKGGDITGTVQNADRDFVITGTLDRVGKGTIKIGRYAGTIQFSAIVFDADYYNDCGARHASGVRIR